MSMQWVIIGLIAGGLGGLIGSAIVRALTPWWAKGGWQR